MKKLSDIYILSKLKESNPVEFESQFRLGDIVGKTIKEHRLIAYQKFRQPTDRLDDPHKTYEHGPNNLDAIIFSDDTFLVAERRADGESCHLGFYFFNGKNVLYSDCLFDYQPILDYPSSA